MCNEIVRTVSDNIDEKNVPSSYLASLLSTDSSTDNSWNNKYSLSSKMF